LRQRRPGRAVPRPRDGPARQRWEMSFLLKSPARDDRGYLLGVMPPAAAGSALRGLASTHGFSAVGHTMSALTGLA